MYTFFPFLVMSTAELARLATAVASMATVAVTPFLRESTLRQLRQDAREAAMATAILVSMSEAVQGSGESLEFDN